MQNAFIIQLNESEFKAFLKSSVSECLRENEFNEKIEKDKILNLKEASAYLNLAPQTLYGFTSKRKIPFIKKGKKLYFKKERLDSWLNEGVQATNEEIQCNAKRKGGRHE